MKKLLALFLSFALTFSLVACDKSDTTNQSESTINDNQNLTTNETQDSANQANTEFEIVNNNFEEVTYQVGGFNFYCPKVCKVATESKEMGFALDNDMGGVIICYQNCQGYSSDMENDSRYVVLASAPCMYQDNEEANAIASTVSLENIDELTKDQIVKLFNDSSSVRVGWLGNMTINQIDMVFEKSENVTINGIEMVKFEGYFDDIKNEEIPNVPFYAYYMITNTNDGMKIPTHYIGLPLSNGTYEEVVSYMDTYIQRVEKIW